MLRAGAAETKITPSVGTPLAGYFTPRISTGVHDDLFARALVLDDGRTRLALVSCDLIAIKASTVAQTRRLVEDQCGIPGKGVMIACSHTHTGPYTSRVFGCDFEPDYLRALPGLIAGVVRQALERSREARIGFGTGEVRGISFNRRFHMKDGTVRTNPGVANPDIVRPAGPSDDRLGVLKVERIDGGLIASWVNFAVHGDVVSGNEISADFPGVLAADMKRDYADAVFLFANGCCGDLNHINVNGACRQGGFAHAEMMGTRIAEEARKAMASARTTDEASLSCSIERVELPRRTVPEEDLRAARELLSEHGLSAGDGKPGTSEDLGSISAEVAYARELVELAAEPEKVDVAEVQALRIGKVAIVAIPAEVFCEIGMEIRHRSTAEPTFVVGYANGMVGYIPTEKAFAEGGYETRLARSSKLAPHADGLITSAAERALQAL